MIDQLQILAQELGYVDDPGFLRAEQFDQQINHRHTLRLAAQKMGVEAAFGLWASSAGAVRAPEGRRYTPLVFLARADTIERAEEIHRSVWSQGVVPFLLIATPEQLLYCDGFAYAPRTWKLLEKPSLRTSISTGTVRIAPVSLSSADFRSLCPHLTAASLRGSVAWRDFARSEEEYVDGRLLRALAELVTVFSATREDHNRLSTPATNALVARLLYLYFLVDRGFVTQDRITDWGFDNIRLESRDDWPAEETKRLFRHLDRVFNGSIFPLADKYEQEIGAQHLNDLRRVLRHGDSLSPAGLQYGFLEYDFATLRTETLSAIYEMFLKGEEADAGTQFGAYYTPPFLADYVLDRLEEDFTLEHGRRVLDPAAGSGVFLVGAYRRIVERELPPGASYLNLKKLHNLMIHNIHGVEVNTNACHVAAFSLYLTMLDYVDPVSAGMYSRVEQVPRLFPPMLQGSATCAANIQALDFFSTEVRKSEIDVVVGNPPWVQLRKAKSKAAIDYLKKSRRPLPIGDGQIAELFTWKALREHLKPGGRLGFLLPMKSLVNERSDHFNEALRAETQIVGIADLSHLRYILFRRPPGASPRDGRAQRARQSTVVLLLRNQHPEPDHSFWLYRPIKPLQPIGRRGKAWGNLWILIHDWTQAQWHVQLDLTRSAWTRVFNCAPIDRRVLEYLEKGTTRNRRLRLGDLGDRIGLKFRINVDEGLDRAFVLGTDEQSATYWLRQLGLVRTGFLEPGPSTAVPLPEDQFEKATPTAKPFLSGNIVLMPRSCERADFVEPRVAYSFSMIGATFPDFAGKGLPTTHRNFLQALAAYLNTSAFRYLAFLTGRRMIIDRAQIELSAVRKIVWPFGTLEDPIITSFINASNEQRETMVFDALGITEHYRTMIQEFFDFRLQFRDGSAPEVATRQLQKSTEWQPYLETLRREIDRGGANYQIQLELMPNTGLAAILIAFCGQGTTRDLQTQPTKRALLAYNRWGASCLTQTRFLWRDPRGMESVFLKPLESVHWTRERAFSDADAFRAAAMSGFDSEAV